MEKRLLTREHLENIPELNELPEGKILLLGSEIRDSGLESFFGEKGKELVFADNLSAMGETGSAYRNFALIIAGRDIFLQDSREMGRLFLELTSLLKEQAVLIAFFASEPAAGEMEGAFHTNREIEQMVSNALKMERIATIMDGTRRVIARK